MNIDWQKPLEAVHKETKEVVAVSVQWEISPDSDGDHWLTLGGHSESFLAGNESDRISPTSKGWRIRNVQPTPAAAKVDGALVERMVALVRDMADDDRNGIYYADARAIAALLPKPVDPDDETAKEIASEVYGIQVTDVQAYNVGYEAALKGLKRGRELATKL